MPEFIDFELSVEDNKNEEKDEEVSDNDLDSFIDDNDEVEDDRIFYQKFENATASVDDILTEEYHKTIAHIEKIESLSFCETSEEEAGVDNFKGR